MTLLRDKSYWKLLDGPPSFDPGSLVLVGGDWNLEPNEFPIDLVQGSGLHRPLARPGATTPQGTRRLDWFLASTALLPSTGWEELTAYKPDHTA
eukprot:1522806-Amphidinium_carterae.1